MARRRVTGSIDRNVGLNPSCLRMKRATPKSIAAWTVTAAAMVAYQLAGQRWPAVGEWRRTATTVGLIIMLLSWALMVDAPVHVILPSSKNSPGRNALNSANFATGLAGGISFLYLAGFFGRVVTERPLFWWAASGITACIVFQSVFATLTTNEKS